MATDPAAASASPPVADAQDPLPESNWFWRRIFIFALSAGLLALVWFKVNDVAAVALTGSETAIAGLVKLLRLCLYLIGMLILFYLLAPSAEQLVKLIQTAKSLREGVSFTSTARSTGPEGSAENTNTAGPAPAEPPPPAPLPPAAPAPEADAAPRSAT